MEQFLRKSQGSGKITWTRVKRSNGKYGYIRTKNGRPVDFDEYTGKFKMYDLPDTNSNWTEASKAGTSYGKIKSIEIRPGSHEDYVAQQKLVDEHAKRVAPTAEDLFTIGTLGGLNNLSPTQWVRRAYDLGEAIKGNMSWDKFGNNWFYGNNGLVSDEYARENPNAAMAINLVGDVGAFGTLSALRKLPKYATLMKAEANNIDAQIANAVKLRDMFSNNVKRTRIGDVEIDNPGLAYRQGDASMGADFLNTGIVSIKNGSYDNPMFAQGKLFYGSPSEVPSLLDPSLGATKGTRRGRVFLLRKPKDMTAKSDLLVSDVNMANANVDSHIVSPYARELDENGNVIVTKVNEDIRRVPFAEEPATSENTTLYRWKPDYGYKKVGDPESTYVVGNEIVDDAGNLNISVDDLLKQIKTEYPYTLNPEDLTNKGINGSTDLSEHLQAVVQSAQTYPLPKGVSRKEFVTSALYHDLGKVFGDFGHGTNSAVIASELNLPITRDAIKAVSRHMNQQEYFKTATQLEKALHAADVGRGMKYEELIEKYPYLKYDTPQITTESAANMTPKVNWDADNWFKTISGRSSYSSEEAAELASHVPEYRAIEQRLINEGKLIYDSNGNIIVNGYDMSPQEYIMRQSKAFQKMNPEHHYAGVSKRLRDNFENEARDPNTKSGYEVWTDKKSPKNVEEYAVSQHGGYTNDSVIEKLQRDMAREEENYKLFQEQLKRRYELGIISQEKYDRELAVLRSRKDNYTKNAQQELDVLIARKQTDPLNGGKIFDVTYPKEAVETPIIDAENSHWSRVPFDNVVRDAPNVVTHYKQRPFRNELTTDLIVSAARRNGYDVTHIDNVMDTYNGTMLNETIIGRDTPVKSVLGNTGSFDIESPNKWRLYRGLIPLATGYSLYNMLDQPQLQYLKQGGKMNMVEQFKNGSKIHIKKKNRGKFTDYCGGEVTQECIRKAKASGNPTLVKRATFADNARKWKHKEGGKAFVEGVNVLDSNPRIYKYLTKIKVSPRGVVKKETGGSFVNNALNFINSDTGQSIIDGVSNIIQGMSAKKKLNKAIDALKKAIDELYNVAKNNIDMGAIKSLAQANLELKMALSPGIHFGEIDLGYEENKLKLEAAAKATNDANALRDQALANLNNQASLMSNEASNNITGNIGGLLNGAFQLAGNYFSNKTSSNSTTVKPGYTYSKIASNNFSVPKTNFSVNMKL